jgi:Protein of unknown function (DUF2934)
MAKPKLTEDQIREAAYHKWLEDGAPHGKDQDYWYKAEEDLGVAPAKKAPAKKAAAKKPATKAAAAKATAEKKPAAKKPAARKIAPKKTADKT